MFYINFSLLFFLHYIHTLHILHTLHRLQLIFIQNLHDLHNLHTLHRRNFCKNKKIIILSYKIAIFNKKIQYLKAKQSQ